MVALSVVGVSDSDCDLAVSWALRSVLWSDVWLAWWMAMRNEHEGHQWPPLHWVVKKEHCSEHSTTRLMAAESGSLCLRERGLACGSARCWAVR